MKPRGAALAALGGCAALLVFALPSEAAGQTGAAASHEASRELRAVVPQEVEHRIVQIEVRSQAGDPLPQCGVGFLVTPRVVVSAYHVLKSSGDTAHFTLITPDGHAITATLDTARLVEPRPDSAGDDVAFLVLDQDFPGLSGLGPVAWPHRKQLPDGTGVIVSFHREPCRGEKDNVSVGVKRKNTRLSSPVKVTLDTLSSERLQLDAPESRGYSGSPIYSRKQGRVIAIYTGADRAAGDRLGYATPLDLPAVRALFLEATGEDLPPIGVDSEQWRQQSYFALTVAGELGGFSPWLTVVPAVSWTSELPFLSEDDIHASSFGFQLRVAAPFGRFPSRYLGPVGDTPIEPEEEGWFVSVRGEAAPEWRLLRMGDVHVMLSAGLRLEYVIYEQNERLPADSLGFGGFGRARAAIAAGRGGLIVEATGGLEAVPSSTYRYVGVGAELTRVDRSPALVGSLGVGYEL